MAASHLLKYFSEWRPSQSHQLLRAVVVGPYPSRPFFEAFANELAPKQLVIVTDAGANRRDIEDIVAKCGKSRGKYFTETIYGHWTSEGCRRAERSGELEEQFVHGSSAKRQRAIEELLQVSEEGILAWRDQFAKALRQTANALQTSGEDLSKYFQAIRDELDIEHYEARASQHIHKDRAKAANRQFRDRYISGFDFPCVPPLGEELDAFAQSFCDSIVADFARSRVMSKLSQRIRQCLTSTVEDGEELLELLRHNWPAWRDDLQQFFVDEAAT